VALTKSNGSAANTYFGYNTFGAMPAPSETVANPFRFTGREWDSEINLYYYRARYYDPLFGRFLSEDPSQFARGVGLYTYVFNDPANEVDPSGLAECFYRISTHTLRCVSGKNHSLPPIIVGPRGVSSGVGACQDEPRCKSVPYLGPVQPGEYRMNRDLRAGHEGFYRLEPVPPIPGYLVRSHARRGGFGLHPGRRTLGCINVLKDDPKAMQQYKQMLNLLEAEDGQNYLLVAP
jgi:RHS repeat-associated protein